MLTEKKMTEIAQNELKEVEKSNGGIELVILNQYTIKKPYGMIFFYTSKKFYETKDNRYGIAGNGPFLVENKTGNIISFGSNRSEEYYIKEYEAGRWPIK